MKVSNIGGINFPENNDKNKKTIFVNNTTPKTVETDSLNALEMQGRAQIKIPFRGSNSDRIMSDEEFNKLKKEFHSKKEKLPYPQRRYANNFPLNKTNIKVAIQFVSNSDLLNDEYYVQNADIFFHLINSSEKAQIAEKIFSDKRLYSNKKVFKILSKTYTQEETNLVKSILTDERLFSDKILVKHVDAIIKTANTQEKKEALFEMLSDKELNSNEKFHVIYNPTLYNNFKELNALIEPDKLNNLSLTDTFLGAIFVDLYGKNTLNELSIQEKKDFLEKLIYQNEKIFYFSNDFKQMFPLLPYDEGEYCSLLPVIVNSIGIQTKELTDNEIKAFNKNIENLAKTISDISNEDFKNLEITQEYSKDEFIKDIHNKIKTLPISEQDKTCEYFGFKLKENDRASYKTKNGTGYSINGYPINIKNLTDNENIESIRENVQKFTDNNKIVCSDKNLEEKLNRIIYAFGELRTEIGNKQAGMDGTKGSHQYDIFKHSLKVMQGIVQDPEYNKLSGSDKRIMLLASLLHDITKKEGYTDKYHAENSAFDAYYITKKFKLNNEEGLKLYNLIKNHEWLAFVNRSRNEEQLEKMQKSTAYDLRHDNLFDMSVIFTHADLKGVNEEFHDIKNEQRIDFNGDIRSYGEACDFHAKKIKEYINELKKSQPLLPVTKLPKSDKINNAITLVNTDGSTNIKGVYKDKDGLIILKYNELENEDLEQIGFPKNSRTKGIEVKSATGKIVDTGNIKFFVHGLDYANHLVNFDAFSLANSDALLSVSYAELPESKYRFFRPQGIILDCDTKYIHGGGNTDSGSGCEKDINKFKENYIFGAAREKDRTFVSDLLKTQLNMNDEEYIKFVKENENKSLSEIEPEEIRNKIINAFATIKSNIRLGNREYNEMYISNPKAPMAVFAYNTENNKKINNPVNFLNITEKDSKSSNDDLPVKERTKFLRDYAIKNNIPFVVFGD